jgi:release factor glutamine methyltransferase
MNTTGQSEIFQPTDTVGALVESATAELAAAGIPTAHLDTEVLLAHSWCVDRATLCARWRSVVSADCRLRFDAAVARRRRHEPLQYIVGQQEFWSLDFVVTPDVLIPRPETELLVELALAMLSKSAFGSSRPQRALRKNYGQQPSCPRKRASRLGGGVDSRFRGNDEPRGAEESSAEPVQGEAALRFALPLREGQGDGLLRLCDLGSGSGCIAVALVRELPRAHVWALDISEAALDVAQLNAWRHGVAEHVHFLASDGFSAAKGLRFDAIVCNPPYVSSGELQRAQPELAWEPRHALDGGPVGLSVIERVVAEAPRYLTEGGWLLMEIGADQGLAVERLAQAAGFGSMSIRADYAGLPRALVARR